MPLSSRIAQLFGGVAMGLVAGALAHSPFVAGLFACAFAALWEALYRE